MPDLIGHLSGISPAPSFPRFHQFRQLMEVFLMPPDGKELAQLKSEGQYIGVTQNISFFSFDFENGLRDKQVPVKAYENEVNK